MLPCTAILRYQRKRNTDYNDFVAVQSLAVLEEKTYCRSANVLVSISLRDALIHALPTKVVSDVIGPEREEEAKLCDRRDSSFL